jgi:transcriptional regulator with XRE-family HTH domain
MKSEKLGARIRTYRERKNLSREELAQRSGLSLDMINALEEQDLYPSLGPLLKVTRALGLRLGTFMDDAGSTDPLIVRKDQRKQGLAMHTSGHGEALRFYSLGKGKADRHMEPFFIEILPESAADKSLSSHEGEEFIVVHKGKLEVVYAKQTYVLQAGDSIYLNSVVPHWVGCNGDEPAEIYAVLYFPD